jgi:glycosidase
MPWVRDEDEILRVVGSKAEELNMIFIFELVDLDDDWGKFRMSFREFEPWEIKECQTRYQRLMIDRDGWNSLFIENHDNPRSVTRYTDDSDGKRELGSKLLCLMQTFLCGTLYIYQGQEIGMRNAPPEWDPVEYKDIESQNYWKKYVFNAELQRFEAYNGMQNERYVPWRSGEASFRSKGIATQGSRSRSHAYAMECISQCRLLQKRYYSVDAR